MLSQELLRKSCGHTKRGCRKLVLSLVKVLIDSLNEKEIVRQLKCTYEKLVGSISKLEMWMCEKGLENYQTHIKFLRNLQELRSCGTGHRKDMQR